MRTALRPGEWLEPDQYLQSANRAFTLVLQGDGNLVLYRHDGVPLWASDTPGQPTGSATMQDDGMFVLYAPDGSPYWAAKHHTQAGSHLVLQDDGNAVIYAPDGTPIWATNTPQTEWPDVPGPPPDDPPVPGPPPVTPGAVVPLEVQPDRRWLNVDVRGTTAFGFLGLILAEGVEAGRAWVRDVVAAHRFNVLHVCATLPPGDYWGSRECGPHQGYRYWVAVQDAMNIAGDFGVWLQWIVYGALEPFGGVWDPVSRRDIFSGDVRRRAEAFAYEFAHATAPHPGSLYNLANEPDQIGLKHSFGELVRIGSECSRLTPGKLWSFGSPTDNAGSDIGMLITSRAQLHSKHLNRHFQLPGVQSSWVTTKRSGDDPSIDQSVNVFWHDEDWNRGEGPDFYGRRHRDDHDVSPAAAFCAAAHARARQHLLSFHWDGGLFCDRPGPQTRACMDAYHRGLDSVPRLVGGKWRGHHAESFIRHAPYAPTDDPDVVLAHVERGHLWRVVGTHDYAVTIAEHRDFDLRRFGAGRVVARVEDGRFAAGVYRP